EVPEAVIRTVEREFVAFLQIAQLRLNRNPLEPRGETAADEFEQKMQLHVPVIARQSPGNSENTGGAILNEVSDHQNRTDTQIAPYGRILGLIGAHIRSIANLRDAQRCETRAKPRQHIQSLAAQLFRIAGGEQAACYRNLAKHLGLGLESDVKRGICARRLAQQLQICRNTGRRSCRGHRLEINGDLRADDVEADRGTQSATRPSLRG